MPHFDLSMLLSGQYHQWLVSGFFLSIKLSVLAFVLALPLAIVVALLRMAPSAVLRGIGQTYVEAIRIVPLLAHMLFWYFGAPQLLPNAVRTWLYDLNYEAASAVIALVLGVLPVVPGFLRAATTPGGIVANPGLLDTLYAYAWFVTFALSALLYGILMRGQHARPADRPGIR